MGKNTFLKFVPRLVEPSASELNERERIKKEKREKTNMFLSHFLKLFLKHFFLVIFNDFFHAIEMNEQKISKHFQKICNATIYKTKSSCCCKFFLNLV